MKNFYTKKDSPIASILLWPFPFRDREIPNSFECSREIREESSGIEGIVEVVRESGGE